MTTTEIKNTYGWSIGDTISYQDSSTNEIVTLRIIDFNHDDKSDGSGKAGITLQTTMCISEIAAHGKNAYYWGNSDIRSSFLPKIKNRMPLSLQNVIKQVTKQSYGSTTQDYLFLLSEFEIKGSRNASTYDGSKYTYWYRIYQANTNETNYNRSMGRDTDGDGVSNGNTIWWTRSAASSSKTFVAIDTKGASATGTGNTLNGISFAFCI